MYTKTIQIIIKRIEKYIVMHNLSKTSMIYDFKTWTAIKINSTNRLYNGMENTCSENCLVQFILWKREEIKVDIILNYKIFTENQISSRIVEVNSWNCSIIMFDGRWKNKWISIGKRPIWWLPDDMEERCEKRFQVDFGGCVNIELSINDRERQNGIIISTIGL